MTGLDRLAAADALPGAYGKITQFAGGLTEADAMRPSRCAGWTVLDVLYHQLLDARRALVTFASPSPRPTSRPSDRPQAGFPSSAERPRPGPVSYKA